jgi:protein TonB
MNARRAIGLATWFACALLLESPASAQDTITAAKSQYAAAAYDEALQILDRLQPTASPNEATEVALYRVFCLVALGRADEARQSIESIVRRDPLYHPSTTETPPRVRALFEERRRALLPTVVKDTYAEARKSFERKDMERALAGFETVVAVLDETENADDSSVADLRTLAAGFADLSRAAATPAPPQPAPRVETTPPPTPAVAVTTAATTSSPAAVQTPARVNRIYTTADTDVIAPSTLTRSVPAPPSSSVIGPGRTGILDFEVSATGTVVSVALRRPIYPPYDVTLLAAARRWTFKPATRAGQPVAYRYSVAIELQP